MKYFITRKIYDIRPLNKKGEIDFEKIYSPAKNVQKDSTDQTNKLNREKIKQFTLRDLLRRYKLKSDENLNDILIELYQTFEEINIKEKEIKAKLEKLRLEKLLLNFELTQKKEEIKRPPAVLSESEIKDEVIQKNFISRINVLGGIRGFSVSLITLAIIFFFSLSIFKGLVLKDELVQISKSGIARIFEGVTRARSLDFNTASFTFEQAYEDFAKAHNLIESIGSNLILVLAELSNNKSIKTGLYGIRLGKNLTQAAKNLTKSLAILQNIEPENFVILNKEDKKEGIELIQILNGLNFYLKESLKNLDEALKNIKNIEITQIPVEYRRWFIKVKEDLPTLRKFISGFLENSGIISEILGAHSPKKYLIIFQNSSELRATGGFIGSYGLLSISNGRINTLEVNNIYNIDGQLEVKIIPPTPIKKVASAWSTHDANWFFDFKESAKKIAYFFESTGEPTVDGIIAITPKVIEKILELTGKLRIENEHFEVSAENFLEILQERVELIDKKLEDPKRILKPLTLELLNRITKLESQNFKKLIENLFTHIKEKDILIWFKNDKFQNLIRNLGASGEVIQNENSDYLAVVNSNLNGYKTDRYIEQEIQLETTILDDGQILNQLNIKRIHKGGDLPYDWYNKVNSNYIRIYVPKGSLFIEASGHTNEVITDPINYKEEGFSIDEDVSRIESRLTRLNGIDIFSESEKTVFGTWLYVSPKEEVNFKIKYILPFKLESDGNYSMIIQKQPGMGKNQLKVTSKIPEDYIVSFKTENLKEENKTLVFSSELKTDEYFNFVIKKAIDVK